MKFRIAGIVALILCVAACGTKSPTTPDQAKAPEQPARDGSGFMGGH